MVSLEVACPSGLIESCLRGIVYRSPVVSLEVACSNGLIEDLPVPRGIACSDGLIEGLSTGLQWFH